MAGRVDPVLGCNFQLSLTDAAAGTGRLLTTVALSPLVADPLAGFAECSGLEMQLETDDFPEGGNNGLVLKFPKRMKYGEITLKKGVTKRTDLYDWCAGFAQGIGRRKDGVITLRDAEHRPFMVWSFRRALPVKWSGPSLNAQQSLVAMESLTLVHEGLTPLGGAAALANAVAGAAGAVRRLF
ncbi:phage tail protein [Aquincola sp. MAHUQ-54]|uniref:Phage tail protein n=1 Tax=Aquincola agrisoli TaxID=3119538 RepID=A0AAW9QB88_9BURK